jgi:hypothetical protein
MPVKFLWLLLFLFGTSCAVDVREAPSADISNLVAVDSNVNTHQSVLAAPELQVRHFRLKFYGYDTVYYSLRAKKSFQNLAETAYYLVIDANYGGLPRHYDTVQFADSSSYPTQHLHHQIIRCQIFGNMTDSCLYRDRAELQLNPRTVEQAGKAGLSLSFTLASADTRYETLDIPANYINGLLLAVQNLNSPTQP